MQDRIPLDPSSFLGLTSESWLWVGSALLFAFGIIQLIVGKRRTEDEEDHLFVHVIVCFTAGTLYAAMATGVADVTLASGRNFDFGRYVDWSFTTPLLLYGLGLTAMHGRIERKGVFIAIIGLDVLMIAAGVTAGFLPQTQMASKIALWMFGNLFFLGLLWLVWTSLRTEAQRRGEIVAKHFSRNATILTVLWLAYPFVFILGSNGLGTWSKALTVFVILVLDVTAKGVYGLVSIKGTHAIVDAERAGTLHVPDRERKPKVAATA